MKFTDAYFEDEVRDGFYVPSMMKKAWAAQIEVLYEVQQLCKKYDIQYFAEWGTLLGAVRHGGMIPWDDDFDICMMSDDYNRFLEVADELPKGFSVNDYQTQDSDNMVARVNNTGKLIISAEELERYHGFPYMAGIDIFRLDYLPRDKEDMETHHKMVLVVGGLIGISMKIEGLEVDGIKSLDGLEEDELREMQENYLVQLEEICHVKFERNDKMRKQLYQFLIEEVADIYASSASDEVTNLPRWSENFEYRFPKRCFESIINVPFENIEMALPVGYDQLLRKKYGDDYMKPVKAGSAHGYPYYNKFYEVLLKDTPAAVYQFTYYQEDWDKICEQRDSRREKNSREVSSTLVELVPLFHEIHENIIERMKKEEWDDVCSLIAESQDSAIVIGNQIEKEFPESSNVIGILEEYCEFLYSLYNQLSVDRENYDDCLRTKVEREFDQYEERLQEGIHQLVNRKEVVFIPYKAAYWDTMRESWEKVMAEENTSVYVIPAPYYYKDAWGRVKKDDMIYETEGYPEEVVLTSYQDYNFESRRPDQIFIQCPYDEYNYAISLHPFFYAKNLLMYTEEMIYIPALVMDEVEPDDSGAKEMLKSYCNMPGVVYADKVVVQSEQMKEVYVELLTEFAGEETKDVWENKIASGDYAALAHTDQKEKEDIEIPEDWEKFIQKPDGTRKKIVLYTTSASALYCYEEKMIEKMTEVLEMYKDRQNEIAFWWYPDSNVRNVLRKSCPGVWRKYCDLVQMYKEEAWGIWDDTGDSARAVAMCDEALGDGGVMLNAVYHAKKKVEVQNV